MQNQMKKGTGSDYIKVKKQNAIYLGIKTNAELTGTTVNPVKKNGFFYNNMINVIVPPDCSVANGCYGGILTNTRSYELRSDFKQGKYYNNYVCNCPKDVINSCKQIGTTCECTIINGNSVEDCLCTSCAFNLFIKK
jgi:hypothetical protein